MQDLTKHAGPFVFLTMVDNILCTKEGWDEHWTQGDWCIITSKAKCFHKWTKASNPCKYKAWNPSKKKAKHHHVSCMGLWNQKM